MMQQVPVSRSKSRSNNYSNQAPECSQHLSAPQSNVESRLEQLSREAQEAIAAAGQGKLGDGEVRVNDNFYNSVQSLQGLKQDEESKRNKQLVSSAQNNNDAGAEVAIVEESK